MERVRAAIGEPATVGALERLTGAQGSGPISRLFIRVGGNLVPLPVGDVAWFEADGDYVIAHTARNSHTLHLSLNRLEQRLEAKRFLRIHRAHIVNLDQVAAFKRASRKYKTTGRRAPLRSDELVHRNSALGCNC